MNKRQFLRNIREMLNDMERGLYGIPEILDEIWYYYNNERERNKELWKEVKRLRKKLGLATNPLLKQEER